MTQPTNGVPLNVLKLPCDSKIVPAFLTSGAMGSRGMRRAKCSTEIIRNWRDYGWIKARMKF